MFRCHRSMAFPATLPARAVSSPFACARPPGPLCCCRTLPDRAGAPCPAVPRTAFRDEEEKPLPQDQHPRVTVSIVGAGFSGTVLAIHLLRLAPPEAVIRLIERRERFGPGLAYATARESHRLNVPAGRMSAFEDRPEDFLDWLRARPRGAGEAAPTAQDFVPRGWFGAYVAQRLEEAAARSGGGGRLELCRAGAVGLENREGRLGLRLEDGRRLATDAVVLATGNQPSGAPPVLCDSPAYHPDPWREGVWDGLDAEAPVLLRGTGLTAVDGVLSLLDRGHRGPIHAVSRRGLLPARHAPCAVPPRQAVDLPARLLPLLRTVRRAAGAAQGAGSDWRAVVDGLRPWTRDLWEALPEEERARFLRHLRPWWDIHRHRMPGPVADRIEAARARGQLRVEAARLLDAAPDGEGLALRLRHADATRLLRVARVVDCTGLLADYGAVSDALLRGMLDAGLIRPDALRLGLDVTEGGALRGRDGAVSRRLFALGPPTRGRFWEMTAVPEIRRQCEALATLLAGLLRGWAASPPPG